MRPLPNRLPKYVPLSLYIRTLRVALISALVLIACSASPVDSRAKAVPQTRDVAVDTTGVLEFDRKVLHVKPGTLVIEFTNNSFEYHNLTVASRLGVIAATPTFRGGERALTLTLGRGIYAYYSSIPGDAAAGMTGTVISR